jgi:zinc protease
MLKNLLLVSLLLLLSACEQQATETTTTAGTAAETSQAAIELPAGVTLIEDFAGSGDDYSIPFSKYVLDNGLTVILHEDHSDPLVHVDVTFHVGSDREEPGRTGFAHFFEHMMFEGSANVDQGEFSKILSNAGGTLNGSTNSDRTNYYETVPANQLEIALWLEADRMGFLLEAVSQEKFDIQREAVKNERGQRVDNRPYGRISETMMKNLYPAGHPYSWPPIGWIEDLNAANLDDLKRFFLRWYGPNNATLTIGGDLDRAQTLEWIAKYYGPIPPGPKVERLVKQPVQITEDRYVTLEDNIHLPAIAMLFPTVHYAHEDEAPLDAAAKVLGQGRASLLYQRLVQTGRAVSAHVSHACRELSCEMMFLVFQNPASGETLAEMETAIRETLVEFAERGVSDDDLQKLSVGFESGRIFSMQSVSGKVGALAFSEVYLQDPKTVMDDIQRYSSVTAEQAVGTFKQYIEGRPAVVLSIVPNGRTELAARPSNYEFTAAHGVVLPTVSPSIDGEVAPDLREVSDNFDRSIQPRPGINPIVDLPPIRDVRLANGVRLLAVPNTETPTIAISAIWSMGQRDEAPGKAGLARLTTSLMQEATTRHTAAEFSEALERIGASVSVSSGQYGTSVSLSVLSKYLDDGMALMMERILEPEFNAEDFERIKSRTMESLLQNQKSGPSLASRALNAVLSGPEHPLSYPGSGLPSTVQNITLDEVQAFYAAHMPGHLRGVVVSTSLPFEETLLSLQALGELEVSELIRDPIEAMPEITQRSIYMVNKEGAEQSSIRMGHPSIKYDALGDYYRAGLMNYNLGGNFDSRINLNLREDKGYTYGAYTGFSGGPELGSFRFSSEINKDATALAITEVISELENYSSVGMTEDEFEYMQSAIGQRDALNYETPSAKLGLVAQILRYDLPLDYRRQQQAQLKETGLETLNALASDLINPERMAIVVVGDIEKLKPQLESLGMPIIILDQEGALAE